MIVQIKNINLSHDKFSEIVENIKNYGVIKIKDTYKLNVKDNQVADILNLKSELAKKGENIIVTVNL